jgi:uncharacterized membrane protein YphA (DoxX/SURF4 family)
MPGLREQVGWLPWEGIEWTLRLVLAGVFFYACADKLVHPQAFARIVDGYQVLPARLVWPVAVWLPWLELLLGVCLFTGLWRDGAVALSIGLLATFWLLLVFNYFRGVDVNCGCFSSTPADHGSMIWYIGRDAVLLALPLSIWDAGLRIPVGAQAARR